MQRDGMVNVGLGLAPQPPGPHAARELDRQARRRNGHPRVQSPPRAQELATHGYTSNTSENVVTVFQHPKYQPESLQHPTVSTPKRSEHPENHPETLCYPSLCVSVRSAVDLVCIRCPEVTGSSASPRETVSFVELRLSHTIADGYAYRPDRLCGSRTALAVLLAFETSLPRDISDSVLNVSLRHILSQCGTFIGNPSSHSLVSLGRSQEKRWGSWRES